MLALQVCLGIRNSKKFDGGLGYRDEKSNTVRWKGIYSHTAEGWAKLVERCVELHALGIHRVYING